MRMNSEVNITNNKSKISKIKGNKKTGKIRKDRRVR